MSGDRKYENETSERTKEPLTKLKIKTNKTNVEINYSFNSRNNFPLYLMLSFVFFLFVSLWDAIVSYVMRKENVILDTVFVLCQKYCFLFFFQHPKLCWNRLKNSLLSVNVPVVCALSICFCI